MKFGASFHPALGCLMRFQTACESLTGKSLLDGRQLIFTQTLSLLGHYRATFSRKYTFAAEPSG